MREYASFTYNDTNPLRRISHRIRFAKIIEAAKTLIDEGATSFFDFGCGDAHFLNMCKSLSDKDLRFIGFEPYNEPEAGNTVPIVKTWEEVEADVRLRGRFDCVFCTEVLEHFTDEMQDETIGKLLSVLTPGGKVIISVPIEIGMPALIKGIFRRFDPHLRHEYDWNNIFSSTFGRPLPEYRQGRDYLDHLGFYYKDLEKKLRQYFVVEKRWFSPVGGHLSNINSQVFYLLSKK